MIGTLGNAVFQASINKLFTFDEITRSGDARFEEHNVISKKPKLEFVGPGLDTVTFNVRLDRFFNIKPEEEMEKMREARNLGQILPLTIGGKYWGDWVLTSLSEISRHIDNRGRVIVAEISITLKEVAYE